MPSRLGGRHGHCLLPHEARLCVARSTLVTIFLQCFGLLHDSVKNFFACGGLKVRRHSAWLSSCCLPAADRVVQLIIRRCGVCIGSVARFGVVEIKRGISAAACACVRDGHRQPVSAQLSAPRGLRRATPRTATAARVALFASGRRRLPPRLHYPRDGRVLGLVSTCCVCTRVFEGFRVSALQNANFFQASRGALHGHGCAS